MVLCLAEGNDSHNQGLKCVLQGFGRMVQGRSHRRRVRASCHQTMELVGFGGQDLGQFVNLGYQPAVVGA